MTDCTTCTISNSGVGSSGTTHGRPPRSLIDTVIPIEQFGALNTAGICVPTYNKLLTSYVYTTRFITSFLYALLTDEECAYIPDAVGVKLYKEPLPILGATPETVWAESRDVMQFAYGIDGALSATPESVLAESNIVIRYLTAAQVGGIYSAEPESVLAVSTVVAGYINSTQVGGIYSAEPVTVDVRVT